MKKILFFLFLMLMGMIVACSSTTTKDVQEENEENQTNGQADSETSIQYPEKPVTMIVPFDAGGGTDATARALANAAEEHLGEAIGVVNKPGGGGAVGLSEGANAKPDGYTVTMMTVDINGLPHLGLAPITYEDFIPIVQVNFDPAAVTVPADAPYNTLEEFLNYVKENPSEVRVGNSGPGGIWHLAAASIEKATGVEFRHIPFDGAAPAVTALLGGHVDAVTVSPAEVLQYVQAGDLKTLAVMSDDRSAAMPDVPTMKELGLGDVSIGPWRGIGVPKDTPEEVVEILMQAFLKAVEEEEFTTFMENNGLGIVIRDGEEFAEFIAETDDIFRDLVSGLELN